MAATALMVSLLLVATACGDRKNSPKNGPIRLAGQAQGTYYSIAYYDALQRDLQPQVDSLLKDFDHTASLWVDSSEICRFNRCADSMAISPRFADLFRKSQQTWAETDGCFDCRVGPLVSAYGFARKQRTELSERVLDSLITLCRGQVWLDSQADGTLVLHKEYAEAAIDFNAIAQGYSVDLLCDLFDRLGISDYLIDVGGEVRAKGGKPDGSSWSVGVERPAEERYSAREVEVAVALDNLSIVTSGSYRKYYEKDGMRYSHTIDPATGRPVAHQTLSASVIDSTAWRADALATAFMVMGVERGREWLQRHPEVQEVFFIYDSLGEYRTYATPAFQQRLIASE